MGLASRARCQSHGRVMKAKGGGVIINLITANQEKPALSEVEGAKSEAAFVASMNGLDGFARQAARELSPHGIRVYAVKNTRDTILASVLALFEGMEKL